MTNRSIVIHVCVLLHEPNERLVFFGGGGSSSPWQLVCFNELVVPGGELNSPPPRDINHKFTEISDQESWSYSALQPRFKMFSGFTPQRKSLCGRQKQTAGHHLRKCKLTREMKMTAVLVNWDGCGEQPASSNESFWLRCTHALFLSFSLLCCKADNNDID